MSTSSLLLPTPRLPFILHHLHHHHHPFHTLLQIAALSLGAPASSLVKAATCISCLGACAAYATFIAGMLTQLFPVWEEVRREGGLEGGDVQKIESLSVFFWGGGAVTH